MGKALVVKGLKVNNPIGLVSLEGVAPAALSAYYERNTSITEAQAESLNALVKTLIAEGLWDKLHYFYPFLGNTLEDMTLECVNTENEDLFATSGLSGLSVDGAYLLVDNATRDRSTCYPTSITAISPSDVSIIMAGGNPYIQSPIFMDALNGNKRIDLTTFSAGGAPMRLICGVTENGSISNITGEKLGTSTLERVVCGTINNGNGVIWNDKAKYAEGTGNTDFIVGRCINVFTTGNNTIGKFSFFAMGRYMTEAEWGKFYDALLVFLKATGKHS